MKQTWMMTICAGTGTLVCLLLMVISSLQIIGYASVSHNDSYAQSLSSQNDEDNSDEQEDTSTNEDGETQPQAQEQEPSTSEEESTPNKQETLPEQESTSGSTDDQEHSMNPSERSAIATSVDEGLEACGIANPVYNQYYNAKRLGQAEPGEDTGNMLGCMAEQFGFDGQWPNFAGHPYDGAQSLSEEQSDKYVVYHGVEPDNTITALVAQK